MRALLILIPATLFLCGCAVTIGPGSSSWGGEMTGSSGEFTEGRVDYRVVALRRDNQPFLVIVADGVGGGSVGGSGSGEFATLDGRKLEWSCDTQDGRTGAVTVNGSRYELVNGGLFLITARQGKTWIRQANPNLSSILGPVDLDSVKATTTGDVISAQFLDAVGKPKAETR